MRTPLKPGTIGRATNLRTHATDAERKLWYKLRELKALGYHFRRQVPFRSYILDFVEHSAKLVIELDGGQHGEDAPRSRDEIRDSTLRSEGYRVIRFWNAEVLTDADLVTEYLLAELKAEAVPHPARCAHRPPHKGEVNS
jgi:very-short-patch-repair endonuclease